METFSALLVLCEGNPPVTDGFPSQRPLTRSFDVFFDLSLNKRLSWRPRWRWFETPSRSLWCHCNVLGYSASYTTISNSIQYTGSCDLSLLWCVSPRGLLVEVPIQHKPFMLLILLRNAGINLLYCLFKIVRVKDKKTAKPRLTGPLWRVVPLTKFQ